ncbi:MAG: TRAP transporter large permease [Betaproteobacteria bacterium]|nr:TRAP transporter large permease [Betaproteobacteria bacterium]
MELLSPQVAGWIVLGLLLVWLTLGVHIGVALGLTGFIGIYLTVGPDAALAQIGTIPFSTTNSFALAVIPLFILMGSFATVAAITTDLFRAAYVWLGNLRGGLAMATVMSSAAFGAASGSTIVNAAVFTRMAMPEMTRFGYDVRLSAGCIAAAGTLAALIPPSILMVVYAVITEQSIGKLLIAGIVPGILTAVIYCGGIYMIARMRPSLAPLARIGFTWRQRFESLYGVYGIIILFALVVGGIYGGYFPATYAGAVGAFGAFVIALVKGRLGMKSMVEVLKEAAVTTSVIFIIVIGGIIFARFLTYSGLVEIISTGLLGLGTDKYVYLLGFVLLFLVLGCFIEPIAIMVMTLPIMFPVLVKAGFDPIWLGVVAVKLAEISVLTPPVGLNVFVVKSASPVPVTLGQVFAGVTPFIVLDLLSLVLYVLFPEVLLWLPNLMKS